VCAPRPRLASAPESRFFRNAAEEGRPSLAPAMQEGAEAHAAAPPRLGTGQAAFPPCAAAAPLPRCARAAPPARLTPQCNIARLPQLRVLPRAAAGPHSSSKHCSACALQLCRAGRRQPMTCDGTGAPALRLLALVHYFERVCRSCGCPRAAAGPHSSSKDRGDSLPNSA
jgi:hypothetical protein